MIEDARGWKRTLVDKGRRGSSHFLSPPLISSPLLSLHHAGTYSTYLYSDAYCLLRLLSAKVFLNYVLRYSNRNVYLCGKHMVNYESIQIHLRARWTA